MSEASSLFTSTTTLDYSSHLPPKSSLCPFPRSLSKHLPTLQPICFSGLFPAPCGPQELPAGMLSLHPQKIRYSCCPHYLMWSQVHVTPSQQESSKLIFLFLSHCWHDSGARLRQKETKKSCTVLIKGVMNWLMDISCWMYFKFLDGFMKTSPDTDLPVAPSLQSLVLEAEASSEKNSRVIINKWGKNSENIARKIFN